MHMPTSGRSAGSISSRRILLVEDDPAVRRSLQLLFAAAGYDVRAYPSGAGLAAHPEALRADCLICDLLIPETDALALLHELRGAGWTGPAILISGHLTDEWAARALEQGFVAVFPKPLTGAALTSFVDRLFSERGTDADEG
jgi:DNA-binding NtrC family response regulator